MKKTFSLLVVCLSVLFMANAQNPTPINVGSSYTIHSKILNEDRILNVYVPQGFDKTKKHSVIYLLDGSINEDFLHIAGLVQFFNLQFDMPETIVVGIANIDRKRDFTFVTNEASLLKKYPTTGGSEKFIDFLEKEAIPFIEKAYPQGSNRYLIGQSLGGLLATEVLLKKPQLFSDYLIVSPSLWWDNESLLKQAKQLLNAAALEEKSVYISVGANEDKLMVKEAKQLFDILNRANIKNLKLNYNYMEKESHGSILHNSIYQAFAKIFKSKG